MNGLSAELLQKVKRIELKAGHFVQEAFSGGRLSAFRGQGMEWEDVRAYVPGDDVRRIDWKVTARLGQTQIKQFREERELVIYLLIDVSRSSLFGSVGRLRADAQAELAAVLALATTRSQDRIGVIFFADEVVGHIPPASGRAHVFKLVRDIVSRERDELTDDSEGLSSQRSRLGPVVDLLCRLRKRKTVVFVLSDLLLEDLESALSRLARRHEARLLWMPDPLELSLPEASLVPLHDSESGQRAWIDLGDRAARTRFESLMKSRRDDIEKVSRQLRCPLVCLENDESSLDTFVTYLRTGRVPDKAQGLPGTGRELR